MPTHDAARSRGRTTVRQLVPLATPFRLDLTVNALRRLSTNVVDVFTPEGEYVRALGGPGAPAIVRVRQELPGSLTVATETESTDHARVLEVVLSMLGVGRDLSSFEQSARRIAWLAPLAHRLRGLKPPRYPSLWETFVNTIVFQQVSLQAASAITRRLVEALGTRVETGGLSLRVFPTAESFQETGDEPLRSLGLSAGKLDTLRRVADALASGSLSAEALARSGSREAERTLRAIKGIGPWTAAIVLLRGLGRLDVFPPNDSSVAANLALIGGPAPADAAPALEALGSERGMLYFFLLLARLEARGVIGAGAPRG